MWSNPFQEEEGEGGKLWGGWKTWNWPSFAPDICMHWFEPKLIFFCALRGWLFIKVAGLHWFLIKLLLHNQNSSDSLKFNAQNAYKMIIFMKVHIY